MELKRGDKLIGKYGNKSVVPASISYIDTIRKSYRIPEYMKIEAEQSNLCNHITDFMKSNASHDKKASIIRILVEEELCPQFYNVDISTAILDINSHGLYMIFNCDNLPEKFDKIYKEYPNFKENAGGN